MIMMQEYNLFDFMLMYFKGNFTYVNDKPLL